MIYGLKNIDFILFQNNLTYLWYVLQNIDHVHVAVILVDICHSGRNLFINTERETDIAYFKK